MLLLKVAVVKGTEPLMNEVETLAKRIDALEMRLAHQDRTIEDLNETITAQWKEIESLTRQIARLGDQLQEVRDSAGAGEGPEPPPPHY
jgi:SlyX protein